MKKINLKKKTKIILSLSLAALVAFSATGVLLLFKGDLKTTDLRSKEQLYSDDASFYSEAFSDNDGNILLYNENNGFVAFKNSDGKIVLNPNDKTASKDRLSSVLNLNVRDKKGNLYIMNSNDNSVKFNTFEVKKEKNSLEIVYSFYKDEASAKEGFKKNGFALSVPVVFTTENGNFKVFVDMKNTVLSNGIYIESLSLLSGLFAVETPEKSAHFIVPDGSGAKVLLKNEIPEDVTISLNTYGTDIALEEYKEGAFVPCYAYADDKKTYSVIITDGDALSEIICKRKKTEGRGYLYSEFLITPVAEQGENTAFKTADSFDGVVSITLVLSENKKNSYNTLAVVARDIFIKKGYLSTQNNFDFGDLPFFVTVIGSEKNRTVPYTTFEDAKEIMALLNSKGVRNIALRFSGALNGGLQGAEMTESPVLNSLGGTSGLTELSELAKEKRSSVWLDFNLFSGGTALATVNKTSSVSLYQSLYKYMNKESTKSVVSDSRILTRNISSAYNFTSASEDVNLVLNDASFLLFTDTNNNINRQAMLENEMKTALSLSVNNSLMLSKPALWLMKGASAVSSVPEKAAFEGVYCVESVPLLQMIIHGSVIYGGEPVNAIGGNWENILKSVEYGAVPSFLFTYEDCANLSYGMYASQTAQYYSKVKSLKAVENMVMTSHEKLLTGVYKITYGHKSIVYVNYNKSVITVDGLLLSPQDFIIV